MYTIKQASARSGVAVDTIRAWERRYGVVRPARTASGYRLYDDEAIRTLDAMRRLVGAGWQPSIAATELGLRGLDAAAGLAPNAASESTMSSRTPGRPTIESPANDQAEDPIIARFVEAAATLDETAISATLDDLFARGSFERVAVALLFPALKALGDGWAAGRVSVAGEHLASEAVARRLGTAFEAAGRTGTSRRRVLVGLPPGSRHELGALAFAVVARRAGLPVAYLGADLPLDDWQSSARTARAAVVAVPTARDRAAADAVVARLIGDVPGMTVAVGGTAAQDRAGVLHLPDRLDEAVDMLRRTLTTR